MIRSMARSSKYRDLARRLASKGSFKAAEAERAGIPRQALAYLCKKGELERVSRGHYRLAANDSTLDPLEDLAVTASSVPNAVICLISALHYHNLTEQIPRRYWIAIPQGQWSPTRPLTRVIKMRNTLLGRKMVEIAGIRVAIFDVERSVVDAFRHLSEEVAIRALKIYLLERSERPNIPKLTRYARLLKVDVDSYIATVVT